MCSSLDIGNVKNIWLLDTYTYLGVVFSCIQEFYGFTSSVCNQYLSGKLVLYWYKQKYFVFQHSEIAFCYSSSNL